MESVKSNIDDAKKEIYETPPKSKVKFRYKVYVYSLATLLTIFFYTQYDIKKLYDNLEKMRERIDETGEKYFGDYKD